MKSWCQMAMVVGLGLLVGCNPGATASTTTASTSVETVIVDVPQATVPDLKTTGTAAEQLDWYLNVLNRSATLTETEVDARFSAALRSELPHEQIVGLTNQLITTAPLSLDEVVAVDPAELDADGGDVEAVDAFVLASNGAGFMIRLAVDQAGRISDLDVERTDAPVLDDEPTSLEAAAKDVAPYGRYRWTAASVDLDVERAADVVCTSAEGAGADEPTAIGYAAKIWILGALADAIEAGELSWDTEVPLREGAISLVPGILQDRPIDSPVEIGDAAKLLFESSDNTAADLLLFTLGRERVEEAQTRWGNTNPELNVPFMTTREMMVLKTSTTEIQDQYLAADIASRRELLTQFDAVPLEAISVDVFLEGPVRPEELSWFASPNDLCTGLARLMWTGLNVDGLDFVVDIITSNHGVPTDAQWSEVAFKGGVEPGMLTMAWLMRSDNETADDATSEWYGFVGNLVNPEDDFKPADPTLLFAAGRDLVADEKPNSSPAPSDDTADDQSTPSDRSEVSGTNAGTTTAGTTPSDTVSS